MSETWTYTYDIADQLMGIDRNSSSYGYYEHDDDGNMTYRSEDGVDTYYDWDMDNRLVRIRRDDAPTVSQSYDVDGIRRSRREEGSQTSRFFSSGGMSLTDTRPSGPVSFIQGHQLLGLDLVNQGPGSKMRFFVTDGLGSVRLVVGEDGAVLGGFENDEFGKELANTAPDDLGGHSFTGALGVRRDSSSLFYMRQRYYSAELGRWLSADPIGFSGGLNLYTYANQNPINFVDYSGLDPHPKPGDLDYTWKTVKTRKGRRIRIGYSPLCVNSMPNIPQNVILDRMRALNDTTDSDYESSFPNSHRVQRGRDLMAENCNGYTAWRNKLLLNADGSNPQQGYFLDDEDLQKALDDAGYKSIPVDSPLQQGDVLLYKGHSASVTGKGANPITSDIGTMGGIYNHEPSALPKEYVQQKPNQPYKGVYRK